ncbi:MAG: glycine cleavage system aminomethyltransferase GcvT [Vicinamibacteria bacterium]|nr:glycine cleavage system aminomethyltransferase GcvT [Vicinamibacteria bacterium]
MSSEGQPRKTPLFDLHRESGAKLATFAGWEMPIEYAGIVREHLAVRMSAGLFDVSHMGEFEVEGPGALTFLQRVTANDVARLATGQAQYSALPMPNGAPIDDIIVFRRADERFLLVVNAANADKDWRWLSSQDHRGCELHDVSENYALLALQGPRSEGILSRLAVIDLARLAPFHFVEGAVDGLPAIVSRTGYTGEDGFEIFVASRDADRLWRAILAEGREESVVPVGLGARDTLRLEARLLLYGNDIDETTTLIEAGLGWIVALDERKGDFIGRARLAEEKGRGTRRKLAGFELTGPGIARHGHGVLQDGERVADVRSGTYAPFLKKSIGLCYLPSARSGVGEELAIEIRGRRVPARVVPTPFYRRSK